jgi:uncharacterized protein YndB with AHSA1/START domain
LEPHLASSTSVRITRVYKTSRDKVWRALTDPKKLAKWYSPGTMTATILIFDARQGGLFELDMIEANGVPHRISGKFLEVLPERRLVQTWRWTDFPIDSGESLLTIELRDVLNGTELTLTHEKLANAESVNAHTEGWTSCLEKLGRIL